MRIKKYTTRIYCPVVLVTKISKLTLKEMEIDFWILSFAAVFRSKGLLDSSWGQIPFAGLFATKFWWSWILEKFVSLKFEQFTLYCKEIWTGKIAWRAQKASCRRLVSHVFFVSLQWLCPTTCGVYPTNQLEVIQSLPLARA